MTAKSIGRTEAIAFGLIAIAFLAVLAMSGCNLPQRGARAQGGGGPEDGTQNCPTQREIDQAVDDINRNSKYFKIERSNLKFAKRPPQADQWDAEREEERQRIRREAPQLPGYGGAIGDGDSGGFNGYTPPARRRN
jgi:hypothetical protein